MKIPPLAEFLRWVAEMPPPFRGGIEGFEKGGVRVRAVVADLYEAVVGTSPDEKILNAFDPATGSPSERNRLQWVLAAAHLLWHPAFRGGRLDAVRLKKFLVLKLSALAGIVPVKKLDQEEERREELIRIALRTLGLELPNESGNESEDRFRQVDSIEHKRVLADAARRAKRSKKVREAMARKAAEEAAAKISRE